MFGSSGSGKTFSLEGGRSQDGIVKMILDRLCSAGDGNGGAVAVRLCEVRRGGTAERDLGPPTEFTDSGPAHQWYRSACANRVSAVRLAPTTGAHEGASSRSWTRLELVSVLARSSPSLNPPQTSVRSGGTLFIYGMSAWRRGWRDRRTALTRRRARPRDERAAG